MNKRVRRLARSMVSHSQLLKRLYNQRHLVHYQKKLLPDEAYAEAEQNRGGGKSALLQKYSELRPKYIEWNHRELQKLMGENTDPETLEDAEFCCLAYGFLPYEYLAFRLLGRTAEDRRSFVSEYYCKFLCCQMNDCFDALVLSNKAWTYQKYQEYYQRDALEITEKTEYSAFLSFIDGKKDFIKKIPTASLGRGIELISLSKYVGEEKRLFESLQSQNQIFLEEKVEQSAEMAAFHPESLNTVRFIAFNTMEGVQVPFCFMKTGRDGSVVDNGGAGGIMIGVDVQTGITDTNGFDEEGREYLNHPNSGLPFKGFQLPAFNDAITICDELMKRIPTVKYVGWDLAYTDQGWVLIEGNYLSQMVGPQMTHQRGYRKEFEAMVRRTGVKLK